MAFGDSEHDDALKAAWDRYCDDLRRAGDLVFKDGAPSSGPERAEGFRFLSQAIRLGLEFFVENDMPEFPYLMRYFGPTRKQVGDNADANYLGAFIDGANTYRIVGNRGTADWLVFTVLREPSPDSFMYEIGAPYNMVLDAEPLLGTELDVDWDGSFVVTLSPDSHPGNWIRTTPATRAVRIRQFFGEWESAVPMRVRIERVGGEGAPPLFSPERWVSAIGEAGRFAVTSTGFSGGGQTPVDPPPVNVMVAQPLLGTGGESAIGKPDANQRGVGALCRWALTPDEALIVEFVPQPARFWLFELDNPWASTMDYRWRLSSVNGTQAVAEDDGSIRVVIAHRDPGVPNWLDASGWSRGAVFYRGLLSERVPEFRCRVVPVDGLASGLPAGARRIDAAGRRDQLRRRATGVLRRFPA